MSINYSDHYQNEYDGRFSWRRERQIANLKELAEITTSSPVDGIGKLRRLGRGFSSDDPKSAFSISIIYLWGEAVSCFILSEFQACILTCGAVVERCLKLAYQDTGKEIPPNSKWGLGTCIDKCKGSVKANILENAREILEPRNSRTHALLEHSNPTQAWLGGKNPGIEMQPFGTLIEPYRGDARNVIELTWKIMVGLYGTD